MSTYYYILRLTLIALLLGPWKSPAETLEQMTAEALRENPELRAFEQSVAAAKGGARTARTVQNPELTIDPGVRRVQEAGRNANLFHAEFALSQLLKFPGKRALEIAIAQRNVELTQIALEGFRFQLAAKVRRAFFDGLAAEKISQARTQQVESAKAFVESGKRRAETGYASDFETLKSQADLIAARKALQQAETQVTNARVSLNILTGRRPSLSLVINGKLENSFVRGSATDFLALAMARNPAIRAQARQAEISGLSLRATRFGRRPDFAIGPSVEYLENEQTYGISATLALPLWDQKEGAIETATAEQRRAVAELEKTRAEVAGEVTKASANLESVRSELALYSPAFLDQLKGLSAQAEQSYAQNATTLLIYLDAKRTYFDTLADYYGTLANVAEARADLEAAVGVPLELKP